MFRSLNVIVATLCLAALLPSASSASGWLRRCGGCCDSAPCTTAAAAPAKAEPKYEDRVVTRYKAVTKEKEVEVCVNTMVAKDVKRTVMVPVTVKEKRKVIDCVPTWKEVECKYIELVPHVEKVKVKQTCIERHRKEIEETVPVCRLVRTQCVDDCGRCYTKCERVTEMVKVKRCVVECVPVTREVEVCRTVCDRVDKTGKRKVCDYVRQEKEVEVCVVRCEPQERVCKVWECVQTKEKRKVSYCEMVPYQETIRVCVSPACDSCCDKGCGQRRIFGGLFNRCGGCCN